LVCDLVCDLDSVTECRHNLIFVYAFNKLKLPRRNEELEAKDVLAKTNLYAGRRKGPKMPCLFLVTLTFDL